MSKGPEPSGVLLVDKARGPTSFDVVRAVRRLVGTKSAGHTGTLDPMATGLLPVCIGDATRIATFLTEGDKAYEGTVRFGVTTETLDAEGAVVEERDASGLTREQVEHALAAMLGRITQLPPMYSARKVGGRRLYELAREGVEVEREAREVTIHGARLLEWSPPETRIFVRCSKGTYIRTLAADLGEAVGTGAHLTALRRVASGTLRVEDARTLESMESLDRETLRAQLLPVETALAFLPEIRLDARTAISVSFGQPVDRAKVAACGSPPPSAGERVRLTSPEGWVMAVGEADAGGNVRLVRVLRAGEGPGTSRRRAPS